MTKSIGVLLPSSTITPMGKDFERGLNEGLEKSGVDTSKIEIVKQLIGQGGDRKVEEALDQLFGYHDVDVVTGIMSSFVMTALAEKFEKRKKVLLNNNLGEHLVQASKFSDHIYLNTISLYQHCWLLGRWAAKIFGEKIMIGAALYDVGYSFQLMFDLGVRKEIPEFYTEIATCPMPESGQLSNMEALFEKIEENQPDCLFALFCGEESTIFLDEFVARGYHKKITLIGLPFLLVPGEKSLDGLKVITTIHKADADDLNPQYEGIFKQLGKESGQVIGAALNAEQKSLDDSLMEMSKGESFFGLVSCKDPAMKGPVAIVENEFGANNEITSKIIHTEQVELDKEEEFIKLYDIDLTGWMNPYLGI